MGSTVPLMKISVGSDLRQPVTDAVIQWLAGRDHDITLVGPLADGDEREWVDVSEATVRPVADGTADRPRVVSGVLQLARDPQDGRRRGRLRGVGHGVTT